MVMAPSEEKMGSEDRKKLVQSLVNSIPSKREELFNWELKWNYIDKVREVVCLCVLLKIMSVVLSVFIINT